MRLAAAPWSTCALALLAACGGPGAFPDVAPDLVSLPPDPGPDVAPSDASDAAAPDSPPMDATPTDASNEASAPDVVSPDVVATDAPAEASSRDAGVDAGLLAGMYPTPRVRVAIRETHSSATPPRVNDYTDASGSRCFYYAGGEVRGYINASSGLLWLMARLALPARHAAGDRDYLTREITGSSEMISDVRVERGAVYTAGVMRQNFHVSFRLAEFGTRPALVGIPGVSVDPDRADIWLLGCPLMP